MDIQDCTEVEVLLEGGLGNQLFGWSAGYNLARRTNASLLLNTSQLSQHGFQLDSFDLAPYSITNLRRPKKPLSEFFKFGRSSEFREASFEYDSRIEQVEGNILLRGYFQSWKYSWESRNEIKEMLGNLKNPSSKFKELSNQIINQNFIGVHVRRGDYVHLENYHGLVKAEYYSNSQDLLKRLLKNPKIVVFSDDIDAAKTMISNADLYISSKEVPRPAENLVLMSKCSSLIGANSSFSLWAAMINTNPEGTFIFPHPWFTEKSLDTRDLLPNNFLTLGNA